MNKDAPAAICGYPLPGWRLDKVEWSEIQGQPDGWIVALKREGPDWHSRRNFTVMARSDLGPLEAWDEALRVAQRDDARHAQAMSAREGQDRNGLGAQLASAVGGNADAPEPSPQGPPHEH